MMQVWGLSGLPNTSLADLGPRIGGLVVALGALFNQTHCLKFPPEPPTSVLNLSRSSTPDAILLSTSLGTDQHDILDVIHTQYSSSQERRQS